MNRKPPVVCIALPTWEGEYAKSTVQVISRLARDRQVLYVDYQYTLKDLLAGILGRTSVPVLRILGLRPRLRTCVTEIGTAVQVLTPPPMIPINVLPAGYVYEMLRRFNQWIVLRATRRIMRQISMVRPIVVNAFNPFIGTGSVGKLDERSHVYYCYDEITAAPWAKRHGGNLEKRFLAEVDAVITTSEALEQEKGEAGMRIATVKNGVDADLFAAAAASARRSERRVIGYVGSVDDRFDTDLVVRIARHYPDAQVRIVGRIVDAHVRRRLEDEANIVCTGPQPMASVANEVASFHVGLIPFLRTEFTKHVYPLKVNEYLSAGVPVVMSDFASLDEFAGIVHIAQDDRAFMSAVGAAMNEWSPVEVERRSRIGSQNDWNSRVDQFARYIDEPTHPGLGRAA